SRRQDRIALCIGRFRRVGMGPERRPRAGRSIGHSGGRVMTERNLPGMSFNEALEEKLTQANWSRREFLGRVAAFGAAAALTQLLIACGQAGGSPSAAPPTRGPTPADPTTAEATPRPAPTPVPTPEDKLFVYNWDQYIGEDTVAKFQDKYNIEVT